MSGTPELAADLRLLLGRIVRRLRATGSTTLTASQVSVLANLDEFGPLRPRDLARHEGIRPPTVTRLVDPLVEQRWVSRGADPDDARGIVLALTDEGHAQLTRVRADRASGLTQAVARLAPADVQALRAAVPALTSLLAELSAVEAAPGPGAARSEGR